MLGTVSPGIVWLAYLASCPLMALLQILSASSELLYRLGCLPGFLSTPDTRMTVQGAPVLSQGQPK